MPNTLNIRVGTDPFNPNTSALLLEPENANARLIFGSSSKKFFSLNLTIILVTERMPRFQRKMHSLLAFLVQDNTLLDAGVLKLTTMLLVRQIVAMLLMPISGLFHAQMKH